MTGTTRSIAVIGAGNGGLAAAADLTLRGHDVRLHSRRPERLESIRAAAGIGLDGAAGEGLARIATLSTDVTTVVAGADLVMLVVPAPAITGYARELAASLAPGQPIFLNPGGTGGGLALAHALHRAGMTAEPMVCEGSTLTYAARQRGSTGVTISNVAPTVPFAAFPARHTSQLHEVVAQFYPGISPRSNVMETGMANLNAIEHPAQILLNTGWIEHTRGDFYFYRDGTTASIGRVIDAVDVERRTLATALGLQSDSFADMFHRAGYTTAEAAATGSAFECLQASEANWWFRSPPSMDHRYVHEDVGYGLVPWSAWAEIAGVPVPTIDALITVASTISHRDYRRTGLTQERMGLAGLGKQQLLETVQSGPAREVSP